MKADMLASQFAALEKPSGAVVVDVSAPPSAVVAQILAELQIRHHGAPQGRWTGEEHQ
jgi:gluconate kinase